MLALTEGRTVAGRRHLPSQEAATARHALCTADRKQIWDADQDIAELYDQVAAALANGSRARTESPAWPWYKAPDDDAPAGH